MKKIIALLLVFLMFFTVAISGCVTQSTITSDEQAGDTVGNLSNDVGDISNILDDIDRSLG